MNGLLPVTRDSRDYEFWLTTLLRSMPDRVSQGYLMNLLFAPLQTIADDNNNAGM